MCKEFEWLLCFVLAFLKDNIVKIREEVLREHLYHLYRVSWKLVLAASR